MSERRVEFIYPSDRLGGAQILFARLSTEMAESYVREVTLSGLDGSPGVDEALGVGTKVRRVERAALPRQLVGTTVVASLAHLPYLRSLVSPGSISDPTNRFLFWSLHPLNAESVLSWGGRRYLGFVRHRKRILHDLAADGMIAFMDSPNAAAMSAITGEEYGEDYLPITCNLETRQVARQVTTRPIRVGWIGRLDPSKYHSISRLLDDVKASRADVELVIVGDGQCRTQLEDQAARLGVAVSFLGSLQVSELGSEIQSWTFGVAMGTSALEIAARRVPSAVMDFSRTPIRTNHCYDWLFETVGLSLGQEAPASPSRSRTFADLAECVATDATLGGRCRTYAEQNHSVTAVARLMNDRVGWLEARPPADRLLSSVDALAPAPYRAVFEVARKARRKAVVVRQS